MGVDWLNFTELWRFRGRVCALPFSHMGRWQGEIGTTIYV